MAEKKGSDTYPDYSVDAGTLQPLRVDIIHASQRQSETHLLDFRVVSPVDEEHVLLRAFTLPGRALCLP